MPPRSPNWSIADQILILTLISLGCSNQKISQFVSQFTNIERSEHAVRLLLQRWAQHKEFQGIYDHDGKACNTQRLQQYINTAVVPVYYHHVYTQILDLQGQLEQIMLKIEPPSIWAQAPTDEAAYTFSHQV